MIFLVSAAKNGRTLARHPNLSAESAVYLCVHRWLKEAYCRRKFGPDRTALIIRVEQEIAALPRRDRFRDWVEWLWHLPDDLWLDAVELQRNRSAMLTERDAGMRLITRKNRLQSMLRSANAEERERLQALYDAAALEVEFAKERIMALERNVRDWTAALERRLNP